MPFLGLMASTYLEAMKFNKKSIIEYITNRHQKDGGFHFANIEPSGGADTYYAVSILKVLEEVTDRTLFY